MFGGSEKKQAMRKQLAMWKSKQSAGGTPDKNNRDDAPIEEGGPTGINAESTIEENPTEGNVRPSTSVSSKIKSSKMVRPNTSDSGARQSTKKKRTASASLVIDGKQLTHEEIREIMDKEGTPESSAILKLAKKAHQFVKERDGALLTAFETNDLDYVNFRIFLKRLLLLEFTDEEFTKVCYFFDRDGNGAVDGSEFLVGFQLLKNVSVQKERASFFKAKKEREDKEEGKRREKEKQDELHKESAIDFDYTEEDLEVAEEMIRKAAYKYDKVNGRHKPFEAWTMKRMKPIDFRDLLRSSFSIFLTRQQMGALVRKYEDKKQEGTIITSDFIVSFTRLGVELRDNKRSENVEKARVLNSKLESESTKIIEEKIQAANSAVDFDFTDADRDSAFSKIENVAKFHDVNDPRSPSLKPFMGSKMAPGEFRRMIWVTFSIAFTDKELGALVATFEHEERKASTPTTRPSLSRSFSMGRTKSFSNFSELDDSDEFLSTDRKQRISAPLIMSTPSPTNVDSKLPRTLTPPAQGGPSSFTDDSAGQRGRVFSIVGIPRASSMSELPRSSFNMDTIHDEGDEVDNIEENGQSEEDDVKTNAKKLMDMMNDKSFQDFPSKRTEPADIPSLDIEGSERKKLTRAKSALTLSFSSDVDSRSNTQRSNITSTRQSAKNALRCISAIKFVHHFTKISKQERNLQREKTVEATRRLRAREQDEHRKKMQEQKEAVENLFDLKKFEESSMESAMEKIKSVAIKYEKGGRSAQMNAFQGSKLSPGEFRDMCRRVFGFKLTSDEVSALVHRYDDGGKNIDCIRFMMEFSKMGVDEREVKRKANLDGKKKREEDAAQRRGHVDEASIIESRRTIPQWVIDIKGKDADKKYMQPPITIRDAIASMDLEGAEGNGIRKVAEKAHHFSKAKDGILLRAFSATGLDYSEFRNNLSLLLHLTFTDEEFMHVCKFFDRDLNCSIDGDEFQVGFQLLSNASKLKMKEKHRVERMNKDERDAYIAREIEARKERELQKDLAHTEKDKQSLFEKLKEMAAMICVDPAAYVKELQDMKKLVMNQRIFITNIFRIFPTIEKLTLAETAALMMELDEFSAHHLVIHGEKFLLMIYRLSRLEEKILTGSLDEGEISLEHTLHPLEVDVTLPEREYGMEGICKSFSPQILEKLSTLAELKDKQQKRADKHLGMRDIAEVLAERPKTAVEFPNIDERRSVSSRGSRPGTQGNGRRVRSSQQRKRQGTSSSFSPESSIEDVFPSPCRRSSPMDDRKFTLSFASDVTIDSDDYVKLSLTEEDERNITGGENEMIDWKQRGDDQWIKNKSTDYKTENNTSSNEEIVGRLETEHDDAKLDSPQTPVTHSRIIDNDGNQGDAFNESDTPFGGNQTVGVSDHNI